MRRTVCVAVLTALALTVLAAGSVAASGTEQPAAVGAGETTPRLTGTVGTTQWGTAWVPERRNKFAQWSPKGWGTQAKAKAAGDEWVHIPLTLAPYLGSECMSPVQQYLVFCATSSAPTQTRPIQFDVWATELVGTSISAPRRIVSTPISFWDSGNYCYGWGMTAQDYHAMGFSVLLHFANATDRITLGWARVEGWC